MANRALIVRLYKISAQYVTGFFVGSLVLLTLYGVQAWTGPSAAAPGGNVAAVVDTSATAQSKIGGLLLNTGGATNGLIVQSGNVGIGTTTPSSLFSVVGQIYTTGGIKFADGTTQTTAPSSGGVAFGGMYNITNTSACYFANVITGSCSCPSGFTATQTYNYSWNIYYCWK